jgi:hypothetical protein
MRNLSFFFGPKLYIYIYIYNVFGGQWVAIKVIKAQASTLDMFSLWKQMEQERDLYEAMGKSKWVQKDAIFM